MNNGGAQETRQTAHDTVDVSPDVAPYQLGGLEQTAAKAAASPWACEIETGAPRRKLVLVALAAATITAVLLLLLLDSSAGTPSAPSSSSSSSSSSPCCLCPPGRKWYFLFERTRCFSHFSARSSSQKERGPRSALTISDSAWGAGPRPRLQGSKPISRLSKNVRERDTTCAAVALFVRCVSWSN